MGEEEGNKEIIHTQKARKKTKEGICFSMCMRSRDKGEEEISYPKWIFQVPI